MGSTDSSGLKGNKPELSNIDLARRLNKEKIKVDFKKYLASTVAAGALLAFAAPVDAVAGAVNNTNSKEALFFVDGRSANTEMWWSGSAKLTETVTMGAY